MFSKEELGDIYNEYVDKIYRFVFFKINSHELAQDLTAETFTKVFEYLTRTKSGEREISNMGAFIYSSARNIVTDYYRKRSKAILLLGESDMSLINRESPSARSADFNILQIDSFEEIRNAMSRLSDTHREIVTLYYIEEMSANEISGIMGKPEGTIRVALHRALKELRKELRSGSEV
ncbi:MAG: hypothetical protein A2827_00305 [Candidatus Spechtbacteria bacterium RIFCSPHIGHO2_01_FULL_43_30]|uniref:RNA polymerase sigma factor 70 region 4 type 2 domain-containing protein n=1 Tax=Candidatus Spechtbacteria bacterium RIFCSPHIGHO2_01_FULL_43_30 TaxID=1802158 RepID=A0A1G2H6R6_9BACT|nr:MAG: hypothetical protein A2827_00305 [Candidatus Spechtbacteria bacterium RIFCSPHIGHO2_01_FULL_43_30]